jgi:hypothetical protein
MRRKFPHGSCGQAGGMLVVETNSIFFLSKIRIAAFQEIATSLRSSQRLRKSAYGASVAWRSIKQVISFSMGRKIIR